MKFAIDGKLYDWHDVEDLSLWLLLELEAETRGTAQPLDVATVQEMADTLGKLSEAERGRHPYGMWVFGVSVWASRRMAGEQVTFREAIDFPFRKLEIIPEPQDHKTKPDPTKRPRSASAAAGRKRGGGSTKKTSPKASGGG